jgi:sugar diacid utilization regulator
LLSDDKAPARLSLVTFDAVIDEFERRRDRLVDEVAHILAAEIPAYAQLSSPQFDADLRRTIGDHHDALVAFLRSGRRLEAADLDYVRRSAAERARIGLPLADYLRSLRLGQRRLWEELLTIAGRRSASFLADATRNMMDFIDYAAVVGAEVYLEEQRTLLAEADRVRRDLLEELLVGREPAPGPGRTVARSAGLHWSARCVLILAVVNSPEVEERRLRHAATVLERAVAERVRPLVVVRQHEIVIVRAVTKEPVRLTQPLQKARRALAADGIDISIGASTVHNSPGTLPAAYKEAIAAVELSQARGGLLVLADLRAFDYLVMRADDTTGRLVPSTLHRFAEKDAQTARTYSETLRAYVSAGLNAKTAADRLGVHANTMHYRLGRISDETGCDLRSLDDIVDLIVAFHFASAGISASHGEAASAG